MFWSLLLAHFIADYPLQTDKIVLGKKHWRGLTRHVAIHLVTMLVLIIGIIGADWRVAGPFILALTAIHFALDAGKSRLSKHKPQWVIVPYLLDQVLHVLSISLVSYWFVFNQGGSLFFINAPWIIYAIGYILVTHAWFITERVLSYKNKAYQKRVNATLWPRMVVRAALLTVLLWGWSLWGGGPFIAALAFRWPYQADQYQRRALLTDICVVIVIAVLIRLILDF